MLTTFNDCDMTAVMEAREAKYKDLFDKKHGVKLGFMGFFVKAACMALKDVPSVNASDRRRRDRLSRLCRHLGRGQRAERPRRAGGPRCRPALVAEIEKAIADFGKSAKDGTLKMEDMKGGTFTISNGGVFGILMSTPIINPPQKRRARPAPHRGPPGGPRRPGRDPPDDVPRAQLRPPPDRWTRGGHLPRRDQESDRGSDADADRFVSFARAPISRSG